MTLEQEALRNESDPRDVLIADLMERSIEDNKTIKLLAEMLDGALRMLESKEQS